MFFTWLRPVMIIQCPSSCTSVITEKVIMLHWQLTAGNYEAYIEKSRLTKMLIWLTLVPSLICRVDNPDPGVSEMFFSYVLSPAGAFSGLNVYRRLHAGGIHLFTIQTYVQTHNKSNQVVELTGTNQKRLWCLPRSTRVWPVKRFNV